MKKVKIIAIVLFFVVSLFATYFIGYNNAIKSAQLVEVNENYYLIDFNGQIHEYE